MSGKTQIAFDTQQETWMDTAPCKTMPLHLFFPPENEAHTSAPPKTCFTCPHQKTCLQYGIKTKSTGYFGGQYLIADTTSIKPAATGDSNLPEHSKKILTLVSQGKTNKQINKQLGITNTVTEMRKIKSYYGTNRNYTTVTQAIRQGDLQPPQVSYLNAARIRDKKYHQREQQYLEYVLSGRTADTVKKHLQITEAAALSLIKRLRNTYQAQELPEICAKALATTHRHMIGS